MIQISKVYFIYLLVNKFYWSNKSSRITYSLLSLNISNDYLLVINFYEKALEMKAELRASVLTSVVRYVVHLMRNYFVQYKKSNYKQICVSISTFYIRQNSFSSVGLHIWEHCRESINSEPYFSLS